MKHDVEYARKVLAYNCHALIYALENGHEITGQMRRVEEAIKYIKEAKED